MRQDALGSPLATAIECDYDSLMVTLMRLASFSILLTGLILFPSEGKGADVASSAKTNLFNPLFPSLTVSDGSGESIPLFSLEAYRAEFRYLSKTFHQIDLRAPPVATDGWTHNIAEAEWPLMALCYFGYACANLAQMDAGFRPQAVEEMRWLVDAIQTPRLSGFVTPHFGPPFGPEKIEASVFVHGHFLSLAVRYREVTHDPRYDPIIGRVVTALTNAFTSSKSGVLRSYRDMWWISDNLPALSALARYDRQFHRDTSAVRERFLQSVRNHFLDPATGLLATYVDADALRVVQGPRGISTMYGLHFLRDLSPDLAQDQYRRARQHFVREALGLAAVREFPEGVESQSDIDSGPLVFNLGPSASGFGIAAAAVMGDATTTERLLKSLAAAGLPKLHAGELRYTIMPPVGQAVILFGKTELLKIR